MIERPEPVVIFLQPDSRNEPGLYPDLSNQNKHLARSIVIGTISSPTTPHSTTNSFLFQMPTRNCAWLQAKC